MPGILDVTAEITILEILYNRTFSSIKQLNLVHNHVDLAFNFISLLALTNVIANSLYCEYFSQKRETGLHHSLSYPSARKYKINDYKICTNTALHIIRCCQNALIFLFPRAGYFSQPNPSTISHVIHNLSSTPRSITREG